MKIRFETTLLITLTAAILMIDVLVASQADAVFGTRRRTALVTAAVVHEKDQEAAASQQPAEQPAQQPPAAEPAPEAAPTQAGGVPVGTIVSQLPAGCTQTTVNDVAYQKCGADYYRAAFQGSQLIYVASKP